MALNTHLAIVSWDLALDAALNVLNSGYVDIYDSTGTGQPATPDVAVTTQVKLAHLPLSATAFGSAAGGSKVANAITSVLAITNGTATWFRAYRSDDSTAVIDGTVGLVGADMNLSAVVFAIGAPVDVATWAVGMPVGQ